ARARAAAAAASVNGRSVEHEDTSPKARRLEGAPHAGPAPKPAARRGDSVTEAFAKSFARQLGSKSGQALVRGVLGSLFKGR
ncbi:MAG: helicase HerA-like domain-containing protein, partial [Cereibacter sp.]